MRSLAFMDRTSTAYFAFIIIIIIIILVNAYFTLLEEGELGSCRPETIPCYSPPMELDCFFPLNKEVGVDLPHPSIGKRSRIAEEESFTLENL